MPGDGVMIKRVGVNARTDFQIAAMQLINTPTVHFLLSAKSAVDFEKSVCSTGTAVRIGI